MTLDDSMKRDIDRLLAIEAELKSDLRVASGKEFETAVTLMREEQVRTIMAAI